MIQENPEFEKTLNSISDKKSTLVVSKCCSFCGKSHNDLKKIIVGPNVNICNECVELCVDIIRETDKEFARKDLVCFQQ